MGRAVAAFAVFELALFFRAFIAVLFTFVMPCGIFGISVLSADNPVAMASKLIPALIGLNMVFVGLFTLAVQVVLYRETGFYKRLLVTQIDTTAIAVSNAVRGYAVVLLGLVLLLVEATVLTGTLPDVNLFTGLVTVLIVGAGLFLLAMIPACFVKSSSTMFTWATVLSYVIVFFSGSIPPIGGIGPIVNAISVLMPGYHGLILLRAGFAGDLLRPDLLVSALYMLGCVVLGLFIVRRHLSWS